MKPDIKSIYPYLLPILLIVIVNVFYFMPQFQGKVVRQGDIIQHVGMSKEATDFRDKTGDEALWTNSMFGGMPTYQLSARNNNNLLAYVAESLSLFIDRPAGYFIAGMIGFYILMLLLGVSPWLSLLGAFLFGFTTNNFCLFEAGHNSKLVAIMTSAPVIAGVILTFREKYIIGGIVFGIALGLNILANHPQMTYYLALCLALLVLFYFVNSLKSGKILLFAKAVGVLSVMALLAMGASASKLWTTYEYAKDTMRGSPILKSTGDVPASSSETDGLEWNYAMQWSNGVGDLLATFIPKAVGGGSGEWLDGNSDLGKAVGQRKEFQAPTYWGSLPFTSGPAYFGVVAFFLFIFGLFSVKEEIKWWILSAVLLTLLLSLGKYIPWLNKTLFDYFPLFNKFRAPSSILSITAIFIPILGVIALSDLVKSTKKEDFLKALYIAAGTLGGLCLMLWVFGSSFFDFTGSGDEQYKDIKDVLIKQRTSMFSSSAFRSLMYILLVSGVMWLFIKGKLNKTVLIAVISILGLFDLVQIGKGYLDKRDFVTKSAYKNNFEPRPVDNQILQDSDPNFRVYDATVNTFNSASTSYFHKTIGGYHPAKLQRFQDIIDRHISKNNQNVLNMLNTKYFILQGADGNPTVQRNPASSGNAWFVNHVIEVADANAEIDSLTNFDPAGDVIVHTEFKDYVSGLNLSKNGTISLKTYNPNKLEYESNTESEQFAVFSENWYGPDKGWQAYIDGVAVDHIRVNYLLRGLKVPSGKHTVIFEFHPKSYYLGETISLICSLILLGGLIIIIINSLRGKKVLSGAV
ncbi:MAG: YfhO family protein [Saprospiraceae bacterium]|nr:YfhO family protein [Saprospiraceae bacterium]